jgi:hypothetical protein
VEERTASGQRPAIAQRTAPAVLPAVRMALVGGDGGQLRVMLLRHDEVVPAGGVAGVFVPSSDADATELLRKLTNTSG